MPRKIKSFFRPLREPFGRPAWEHFWRLVVALCLCHGATIERLAAVLRAPSTHRTKHGEFLWKSRWDEAGVVRAIALDTLRRLRRKDAGPCYLIIDETQTLKRAQKMAGVGTLYHHASKRFATGHTMLKVALHYRGVTIPWGTWLYLKKADAPKLHRPFQAMTDLAAEAIRRAELPTDLRVVVLFDAYYLCPQVAAACRARGWHYIGVGKSNRRFGVGGESKKLGAYGRNVLRRSGRWYRITGLVHTGSYRLAERTGTLKKLGLVKVVFSRRRGEGQVLALVTDDLRAAARTVVADYLQRWALELLLKDEKQQLGLGDYRVLRYEAVVRHLHLVDCAYGCLTHLPLREPGAQGRNKRTKVLHLPPLGQLKDRMRRVIWPEAVADVIRRSHEKPVLRRLEQLLAAGKRSV